MISLVSLQGLGWKTYWDNFEQMSQRVEVIGLIEVGYGLVYPEERARAI